MSSSVARKFRVVDGKVVEVTEKQQSSSEDRGPVVGFSFGLHTLPMSHNDQEGYSVAMSISNPTPERIERANRFVKEHGISGVHFDPTKKHNCRITCNRGFKKYLKLRDRYNEDDY